MVPTLKQRVTDFKQGMPVIVSLRNPSLRARHWAEIESLIGRQIPRGESFTLGNLLEMKIYKHKTKIQDISTTASNEATLEAMLQKVKYGLGILGYMDSDFFFSIMRSKSCYLCLFITYLYM